MERIDRLTFDLGKVAPPATLFAGKVLIAAGAVMFALNPSPIALAPIVIGLGINFMRRKTEIDLDQNRLREFQELGPIKSGDWKSLDYFPEMAVIRSTYSTKAYSLGNNSAETSRDEFYEIVLLTAGHLNKFVLARCVRGTEAEEKARRISEILQKDLVEYAPISAHSRNHEKR